MAERAGSNYRSALRSKDLRTLVLAFVVDNAATWSYTIVLISYVFERSHSAAWITALVTVKWVVGMLVGGYAGVLADRYDRRSVAVVSSFVSAGVALVIAVIVGTDASLWLLVVASGALTAAASPNRPATGALVPEVVPESDLIAANSIFAMLTSLVIVIGPGLGGLLLLAGQPVIGVLINAASFVVSGLLYATLAVRSKGSAETGGGMLRTWGAGFTTIAKHRKALVLTMFLVLDSAAINGAFVLMPALADHLGGGSSGYSVLIAASALGGVLVAGLANKLAASPKVTVIIMAALAVEGIPLWVSLFAGSVAVAVPLQVASGAGMVIVDILAFTSLQRDLPRDVLGRVLGSVDVLILGACVLAALATGQVYEHSSLGWALALCGLFLPLVGLAGLPALRALDAKVASKVLRLRDRVALLERVEMFNGASRAVLEQLAEAAQPETVAAGTEIITQGAEADVLWILSKGYLTVHSEDTDGNRVELPMVTAPGYVGELGLLHRVPRSATVTAVSECEMLRIPGEDFLAALETSTASGSLLDLAGQRIARTPYAVKPPVQLAPN